jgi:hypothetical protein
MNLKMKSKKRPRRILIKGIETASFRALDWNERGGSEREKNGKPGTPTGTLKK